MPLSTAYYNSEVIHRKESEGRQILSSIYEGKVIEIGLKMIDWEKRHDAQMKVFNMTNRQVYTELRKLGFQFNNERAHWLK